MHLSTFHGSSLLWWHEALDVALSVYLESKLAVRKFTKDSIWFEPKHLQETFLYLRYL